MISRAYSLVKKNDPKEMRMETTIHSQHGRGSEGFNRELGLRSQQRLLRKSDIGVKPFRLVIGTGLVELAGQGVPGRGKTICRRPYR